MGLAGLSGFWVSLAGELEGADGFDLFSCLFVGVADLEAGFGSGGIDDFALVVEDDRFFVFFHAPVA